MKIFSIVLTEKCNLRCIYCFSDKTLVNQNLDIDVLKRFVIEYTKFEQIDMVIITGGEPLLYPFLKELIIFLKPYTKYISLLTNGLLLNKNLLEFLSNNQIELNLSLDSIKTDYHEKVRGKQKELLAMLDTIGQYKELNVVLNTSVSRENIDEIDNLFEYAQERKFKSSFHILDVDKTYHYSWKNASIEEIDTILEQLKKYCNKSEIALKFMRKMLIEKQGIETRCFFANHNISIYPNGNVYDCFKKLDSARGNIYFDNTEKLVQALIHREHIKCDCIRVGCYSEFFLK